jgi:heptosyltransferase I
MSSAMRILFVKTSSLGDVIHHCPAVTDAWRRFPDADIDWVVEESFVQIAALHPAVRRILPVAVRRWRTQLFRPPVWTEILRFQRALHSENYDFVIDTQGLLKSALIARRANGVRHGYDTPSAREPLASRFYDYRHPVSKDMHAVERNRALTAAALGFAHDGACEYGLVPRGAVQRLPTSPFCVLLTMTSRPDKLWPDRNWVALVQAVAGLGWQSVLPWGSEAERLRCHAIVDSAGNGVIPEAMQLGELATLLARAKAVIGVDTGLSHLAAALRVPAVGLFIGSDPALTGLHGTGSHVNLGGPGLCPSVKDVLDAARTLA